MKLPLRVAMICFLVSVAITFSFYFLGEKIKAAELSGLWNMFLLIVAIAISLFLVKKQANFETKSFIEDFKVALQGGMVFVVLISVFTYAYHAKIDTTYVDYRLDEHLARNIQNVPDEATYLKLQKEDVTWKGKSYLDYIENQEDQATIGLSAYSLAIGHLGIGLFLTFFFAIFTTLVFRKVVLRDL